MRPSPTTLWTRFHPLSRVIIGVATVLILVLFAGVERVGSALAHFSPGGTFDEQCARLPPSSFTVNVAPHSVIENGSISFDALSRMHGGSNAFERTIGLTLANFGHRSTFEVRGLEDRRGARACVRPQVSVELYLKPLTVYVAREYSGNPCKALVIREHEQKHVEVYASFVQEAPDRLRSELEQAVGREPLVAADVAEAQRSVDRRLASTLATFMRDAERVLAERHARIDTPQEYERVRSSCHPDS